MTTETAAGEVVTRFYRAVADRNMEAARACFHEHPVWVLPGRSPIAGEHRGWEAIRDDFLAKLGPLSGGTFSAKLIDVALGEHYVVAVQRATAERAGKRLESLAAS